MSSERRALLRVIGYTLVTIVIIGTGTSVTLSKFEPTKTANFQTVSILMRGPSRVDEHSAARGEPLIQIQDADGKTRRLPSLYYALHPELEQACLRTSEGRFTGARKLALVPIEMCAP